MTDRPQWARNILSFLDHGILDEYYPNDGSADEALNDIEQFTKDRLCQEFGHVIYDDQCNIPEHRFCGWCNRRETAIKERETAKAHSDPDYCPGGCGMFVGHCECLSPEVTAAERDVIWAAVSIADELVIRGDRQVGVNFLDMLHVAVDRLAAARKESAGG